MCTLSNLSYNSSRNGIQNSCALGVVDNYSGDYSSKGYDSYNFAAGFEVVSLHYKIVIRTKNNKNTITISETIVKI